MYTVLVSERDYCELIHIFYQVSEICFQEVLRSYVTITTTIEELWDVNLMAKVYE